MPKVTVAVAHKMDTEEVKRKATPVIEKTVKDFEGHDLQLTWTDHQAECQASTKHRLHALFIQHFHVLSRIF